MRLSYEECFEILNAPLWCDPATLKGRYRVAISTWHPDRHPENSNLATLQCQRINLAKEILDEAYDEGIDAQLRGFNNKGNSSRVRKQEASHKWKNTSFTPGYPDPNALEIFVKSSNILSIGYNHSLNILYVKYIPNLVYAYYNVPETVYSKFLNSDSPGRFRHTHVNSFRYERLAEPNVAYSGNAITAESKRFREQRKMFLLD